MKLTKSIIPIIIIVLLFAAGCRSKKEVAVGTNAKLEKKGHIEVMEDALIAQLDYKTISTKGSVEIRKGSSSKKISTHFKIVKDSILQASMRMLGTELIRITFTPDSVFLVDRMQQLYVAECFGDAMKSQAIDFNFYNLQSLLTNRLFAPGEREISKNEYKKFDVTTTNEMYLLKTSDKNKLIYNFAMDASDRVVSTLIFNAEKTFTLQWTYENFVSDGEYIYPKLMLAKVDIGKHRLDLGVEYSSLDINKNMQVNTDIPRGYKKIDFKQFISSYLK